MQEKLVEAKTVAKVLNHYINGKHVVGQSSRYFEIFNPALGKVSGKVALANEKEIDDAVSSAKAAQPAWAASPPAKRAKVMYNFRDLLYKNMDELAYLVSIQHGKTLDDAKGSVTRGIEIVEFCCGITSHLSSSYSKDSASSIDTYNIRQPLGVVAGITPFNFPAMVPLWMFPVALACGNTFVLKPSERDPACSLRLAELIEEAGLPKGCLNVVNGDKVAVDAILHHPDIEAVSFVGSTKVGKYIYQEGSKHCKRIQALCGAKNHMIVMPDADISQAVDAVMGAAYGSAGERCMAISVLVAVSDKVADDIIKMLVPKIKALKVGPYNNPNSEMGPVISKESFDKINSYIESGVNQGAKLIVDGRGIKVANHEDGFFIGGCLFDKVLPNMKIYLEEIFGPVLVIVRAGNYEEAKKLVIEHEYGNGAAIFTRDGDTASDFINTVNAGMVGINVPIPVPVAYHSFGGWKNSIFSSHAMHGMEGIRFYTKLKTITKRWPSGIKEGAVYNFHAGSEQK